MEGISRRDGDKVKVMIFKQEKVWETEEEKDLAINWSEGRGFWELGWEVHTILKEQQGGHCV